MQKIRKILWLRKVKVVPKRVQPEMRIILGGYMDILSVVCTVLYLFLYHTSPFRPRHVYGRQLPGEVKRVRARPDKGRLRTRKDELRRAYSLPLSSW
jgi:hypothetical protein